MSSLFTAARERSGRHAARPIVAAACVLASTVLAAPAAEGAQRFKSRADLQPPNVKVTTPARDVAPGYVFTAPKRGEDQSGPMMYDNEGDLVWFKRLPASRTVMDFRAQTYEGQPVITWWQGISKRGYGFGKGVIYDQSYRKIAEVKTGKGQRMDFHDFTLTDEGTALIGAYKIVKQDLRSVEGGKKGDRAMLNVLQEVDVETGEVLLNVRLNKQIKPRESYEVVPERDPFPYDYIHFNSIREDTDGNLLVSARATHAVYKIDRETGRIIWRLGGKRSDFKMGKGARFRFQHDAVRVADGTITVFDNNADEPEPGRESRGMALRVNERTMKAKLAREWTNPEPQLSPSQGNMQTLPNGNVFVGWGGTASNVTEFSRDGDVLWEAKFKNPDLETYRGYRFEWTGQPAVAPIAVAKHKGDRTVAHVSWNGATEVASWRLRGGPSGVALVERRTVPRDGFETKIAYAGRDDVVVVEALDAGGQVLGTSKAVSLATPPEQVSVPGANTVTQEAGTSGGLPTAAGLGIGAGLALLIGLFAIRVHRTRAGHH